MARRMLADALFCTDALVSEFIELSLLWSVGGFETSYEAREQKCKGRDLIVMDRCKVRILLAYERADSCFSVCFI